MATALAECAQVPTQIAEWADWATYESTGRRALRPRRRNRIRHPRLWHWPRIVGFTVIPGAWFLGVFHAVGPTP